MALAVALVAPASAEGDPARGARVFQMCVSCHTLDPAGADKRLPGPALVGIIGRTAGTSSGFPDYSDVMIAAGKGGLIWDEKTLDAYIADPLAVVPGTTMSFPGLRLSAERADLIAYIKAANAVKR